MKTSQNDGFIIHLATRMMVALQALSAVERLKQLGEVFLRFQNATPSDEELRRNANRWIDGFIVFKWALVGGLFWFAQSGWFAAVAVSYLLFFNVFSYFYYHGWGSDHEPPKLSWEAAQQRDRRRLISFLQAFFFSFLGFAYLYAVQLPDRLEWPTSPNGLDAIFLSLSNSFTLTYNGFQPCDQLARGVLLLQVLNVFVFLTVLIGNAVPSVGRSQPEDGS